MLVSICIPCYNSSKTLPMVVEGVKNEILNHGDKYEFILVNDGSKDNTFQVIANLCKEDKQIVGIDLSKNFGQNQAKMCAVRYVKGEVVAFMDDDGQHDPKDLYSLINKVNEGYDVVYGKITNKKHTIFKNITSKINQYIQTKIGNVPKGIYFSPYMAYSRFVVDALKSYTSPFAALGAFLLSITNKYANVPITHKERTAGHSGYTLKKMVNLWLNMMFSFSMVPLRVASILGLIFSSGGFILAIVIFIIKIVKKTILPGYTSTLIILLVTTGVILIILGIIGEYLGRIYLILCGMKQYTERCVINGEH